MSGGGEENRPPVAYEGSACTTHDTVLNDSVQFYDPDQHWVELDATVSHGTLYLESCGSYTYEPAEDYVGADSFTFHATNGEDDSQTATVTIDVTNQKAVAWDHSACTPHDAALADHVQFDDYDWIDTMTRRRFSPPCRNRPTAGSICPGIWAATIPIPKRGTIGISARVA